MQYRNITLRLPEEVARWARRQAADKDTSVSGFVGQMLAEQMRRTDHYWQAYERWKQSMENLPVPPGRAADRAGRAEAHDRELDRRLTRERAEQVKTAPHGGG